MDGAAGMILRPVFGIVQRCISRRLIVAANYLIAAGLPIAGSGSQ